MKPRNSRRLLQIALGLAALAPLLTGLLGLAGVDNPLYYPPAKPVDVLLDSNLRFLNGISVAIGICIYLIIPHIEKNTLALRIICILICSGGAARLLSVHTYGFPPPPFSYGMYLEMLLPIVFIVWQARLAGKEH